MGYLTTHVLDTSTGQPAAGVRIELCRDQDGVQLHLLEAITNSDGRCDEPILNEEAFSPGIYELHFHVGDYFRGKGMALDAPAFLDVVPIRFGLSVQDEHYHVPLLISPYGYSTYKGS